MSRLAWWILAFISVGATIASAQPATLPSAGGKASSAVTRVYEVHSLAVLPYGQPSTAAEGLRHLSEMITETIIPDSWNIKPNGVRVLPDGRSLAITQTPENHRKIVDLLEQLWESGVPTPFRFIIHVVAVDATRLPAALRERLKPGSPEALSDEELKQLVIASAAYTPITGTHKLGRPIVVRDAAGAVLEQSPADTAYTFDGHDISIACEGNFARESEGLECHIKLGLSRKVRLELGQLKVKSPGGKSIEFSLDLSIADRRSAILADVPVEAAGKPPLRLYVLLRPEIITGGVDLDDLPGR